VRSHDEAAGGRKREDRSLEDAAGAPPVKTHRVDAHRFHPRLYYLQDRENLLARLRKIEGQVRGLQRMIEEGRYCVDILTQIAAIRAALNKVGLSVLESHTRGCVVGAVEEQAGDEAIAELMEVLSKFVK